MLSAFIVAYNRPHILAACVKAARFVDELIVIDKSEGLANIAAAFGATDRIVSAPWSPTTSPTSSWAELGCW